MKKSGLLVVLLGLCISSVIHAAGGVLPGNGTAGDPYLIEDLADFDVFADDANAGTYWSAGVYTRLECDIDLSGRVYDRAVIAWDNDNTTSLLQGIHYNGVFDGNSHIINKMTIDTGGLNNDCLGLFGAVEDSSALIKNLGLNNVSIIGGSESERVGALIGIGYSPTIIQCYSTGEITGNKHVGGLCGTTATDSRIENSYSSVWITGVNGPENLGGLCGNILNGQIENCYTNGRIYNDGVSSGKYIGGLCGTNYQGTISYCYTVANTEYAYMSGSSYFGGLCGYNNGGVVAHSFWDRYVSLNNSYSGGTLSYTYELQREETFTDEGWDFTDIWEMDEFPILEWQDNYITTIPAVVGMAQAEAASAISASELTIGKVSYAYSNTVVSGDVIYQYPADGQEVLKYTSIDIVVSLGVTDYFDGEGTEADPYLIQDMSDFEIFANETSAFVYWADGVYTKLTIDLDLSGQVYGKAVIAADVDDITEGHQGIAYSGSFDGNGHTISNMNIDTNGKEISYIGLFGKIEGVDSKVTDLKMAMVNIQNISNASYSGAVCGENGGVIDNCMSSGEINGFKVGGLCGLNTGVIQNCSAECNFYGAYAGGVCSFNKGSIAGSSFRGYVDSNFGGGFCSVNNGTISECSAAAIVDGGSNTGGFCGFNTGEIYNCYVKGEVMAGYNASSVGGFAGLNQYGTIRDCYSQCNVSVVGDFNSFANYTGGFCGENMYLAEYGGTIGRCYSAGVISFGDIPVGNVGGFVGYGYSSYVSGYWDSELSGLNPSQFSDGYSTSRMKDIDLYRGWDFSDAEGDPAVWYMPAGDYPRLAWQNDKETIDGSGTEANPYLITDEKGFEVFSSIPAFGESVVHTKLMCDLDLSNVVQREMQNFFRGRISEVKIFNADVIESGVEKSTASESLEGHWLFDSIEGDTVLDLSEQGHHARLHNGMMSTGDDLIFNGVSSFVEVDNYRGISGSGARTVTAKIKVYTDKSGFNAILSWGSFDASKLWVIAVGEYGQLAVICDGGILVGGPELTDGKWHTVAVVLPEGSNNINQVRMYVDGVEASTNRRSVNAIINTELKNEVIIGAINMVKDSRYPTAIIPYDFQGEFDGNGHIISNARCNYGIFNSVLKLGAVKNLGIENVDLIGNHSGGLTLYNNGLISNCFTSGTVNCPLQSYYIGGLAGKNFISGSIVNCYSTVSVFGYDSVGGLAGSNEGTINSSYFAGFVSGISSDVGGIAGEGDSVKVINSFWDVETSGQITSVGGTGQITAGMQVEDLYLNAGWDFSDNDGSPAVWKMRYNEYPKLIWEELSYTPDLDNSKIVDVNDLALFVSQWLNSNCGDQEWCSGSDLDKSGVVDVIDFEQIAASWLEKNNLGSLAGYWKLDESGGLQAEDSSDYGRVGIVYGQPERISGKVDGCYSFDGENDYIEISNYPGIGGNAVRTVRAWIKADEDLGDTDNAFHAVASWGAAGTNTKWVVMLDAATGQLTLSIYGGKLIGGPDLEDGLWHQVAVVLPAGADNINQVKMYVDNNLVSTNASSLDAVIDTTLAENVLIGAMDTDASAGIQNPSFFFKGAIDDVSIHTTDIYQRVIREFPLLVHLELDETSGLTAYDSTKNENHGILFNGPTWTGNGELSFDGADDYVRIDSFYGIGLNSPRTVSAYIKADVDLANSETNIHPIVSWGAAEAGKKWVFMLDAATGQLALSTYGGKLIGGPSLEDGQLHHVAVVLPAGASNLNQVKMYLDGVEISTNAASLDAAIETTMSEDVLIGAMDSNSAAGIQNPAFFFKGIIDDVRIYSSEQSIEVLSDLLLPVHFEFDETSGATAFDSSVRNNDGTLVNGPLWTGTGELSFDGADDYVQVDGFYGISVNSPRTVAAWIKADEDLANAENVFHAIASWGAAEASKKWVFMLDSNTGQLSFSTYGGVVGGGPDLEDGLWHQVAVVLPVGSDNINQVKMYVDGVEIATNAGSLDSVIDTALTEAVLIGAMDTDAAAGVQSPAFFFKGEMDEVRIYNAAISEAEISAF